ncbi:MAG: hypothetical protein IH840_15780, partial [Candidatus Heimdallarchaeota archaeon]|nr:hypothetical protein [Candidatus Heimdallarchaeota archaeon]
MTSKSLLNHKKIDEGYPNFEFGMIQEENNLQVKLHIRKFIVLDELIEDRIDPESSFYGNTINEILEFY